MKNKMKANIQDWLSIFFKALLPSHFERMRTLESENERLLKINEKIMDENASIRFAKDDYVIKLESENERLLGDNEYLQRRADDYENTIKNLTAELNKEITLAIKSFQGYNAKELSEIIKLLEPDGWSLYYASKEILGVDVYKEFIVEDTMGRFEESDGYELKNYAEIAAFGDCSYMVVSGAYEILDDYTIDYDAEEYKEYINKLYPLTIEKIIHSGYLERQEPMRKFQIFKGLMAYRNAIQNEHGMPVENKPLIHDKASRTLDEDEFYKQQQKEFYANPDIYDTEFGVDDDREMRERMEQESDDWEMEQY